MTDQPAVKKRKVAKGKDAAAGAGEPAPESSTNNTTTTPSKPPKKKIAKLPPIPLTEASAGPGDRLIIRLREKEKKSWEKIYKEWNEMTSLEAKGTTLRGRYEAMQANFRGMDPEDVSNSVLSCLFFYFAFTIHPSVTPNKTTTLTAHNQEPKFIAAKKAIEKRLERQKWKLIRDEIVAAQGGKYSCRYLEKKWKELVRTGRHELKSGGRTRVRLKLRRMTLTVRKRRRKRKRKRPTLSMRKMCSALKTMKTMKKKKKRKKKRRKKMGMGMEMSKKTEISVFPGFFFFFFFFLLRV
ncbi:hypothetical protein BO70DRAFT_74960 [Aspergillus heteromorphus CBS 117.55]|uniref:Uncharacterized protein n=1 Tax=Aspergillus heteromorphus CBS 117.55 TaxID=1448321 RepID=A0A317X124_9EURO|nr:uncharacterized protein BO70DRAFT_74960 [Aspergillus heteromorphus CBS 117.55]PWY90648.1 hypothetical protein BO70DRAFT_74960 [Aspergillus heteromorphus CBS 117.55]